MLNQDRRFSRHAMLLAAGLWAPVALYAGGISLSTTPNVTSVTLGTTTITLTDTAVLSGGNNPNGSITFTLYQGAQVYSQSVTVSGNGTYSPSSGYTLPASGTVTGTYQWDASYTGDTDGNAKAFDNNNPDEQLIVSAASPDLSTTLGFAGGVLTDQAFLTGSYFATGMITFDLYGPTSALVYSQSVSVSGNGTYSTPSGYTVSGSGAYQWDVSYSGDGNNNSASALPEIQDVAPEPSSLALCGVGVGVLVLRRIRQGRRAA